jgi:tRNA A-37 threonylcarbamoyl transferase component Bud32
MGSALFAVLKSHDFIISSSVDDAWLIDFKQGLVDEALETKGHDQLVLARTFRRRRE